MPNISTLKDDIYAVLTDGVEPTRENEEIIRKHMGTLADLLVDRLLNKEEEETDETPNVMRLSAIGRKHRYAWLQARDTDGEQLEPWTVLKFMYGDAVEFLSIMLAELSGHAVEGMQDQVEIEGIPGHRDVVIDGYTVDVKSASQFAFKKFKDIDLFIEDDAFGYLAQISAYTQADDSTFNSGYMFAVDKSQGHIAVLEVPPERQIDATQTIKEFKEAVASEEIPPHCYPDKPHGKSGNRSLSVGCSYCKYKLGCWPGVRKFIYSNGPVYLTHVEVEPKVPEDVNLFVENN